MSSRAAEQRTHEFIEQLGVLLEADGMPRVAGRLFGLLLVSAEPQSLDDLAMHLGVSKASVSINTRLLEEKGVIERVGRQADRRDYYQMADDLLERMLEQRIAKVRRFQEVFANARKTCALENQHVRSRLCKVDRAYNHLVDATSRALDEWRAQNGKRTTGHSGRSR